MSKPAKKGAPAALQTDVTTDEEWNEVLERKGLVLVDVYSKWAGPCQAMISTLKKVKMEIGGDILSYAVARNDDISDLERFRGKSEPVWMFIQNGKMVNLFFGAHCPKLQRLLIEELRRVQQDEPPKYNLEVTQRGPEEEARWLRKESIRKAKEKLIIANEEAEKRAKYEDFLDHQMVELCEETAILLYPWVFLDEHGYPIDKEKCPAYLELVQDILPERFDILEQTKIQLDEKIIADMFVESGVEITEDLVQGLTGDKCLAIRLRCKPPPPEWPVTYPYECPEGIKRCPVRAIDDVENYLRSVLQAPPKTERESLNGSYLERHVSVNEPDPENQEDHQRVYPAVWFPPHARNKVHVFNTLFSHYMDKVHPYEEPVKPPPLCAFKFNASHFAATSDVYKLFISALEHFGIFEYDDPGRARRIASNPEDFENKIKYKTGNEIIVIILRRIHDEAFLSFAGNEPYFVTEVNEEAQKMIDEYFPPGTIDFIPIDPDAEEEEEEEDYYEEYDEEDYEDYEEENDPNVPPSVVDLSMF